MDIDAGLFFVLSAVFPALYLRIAGLAQSVDYHTIVLTCDYYGGCTRGPRERKQVRLALETDSNVAIVGGDNRGAGK